MGFKEMVLKWLDIEPASDYTIKVQELANFQTNAFLNRIWYRGKAEELAQCYQELPIDIGYFWKASSSAGLEMRKIHTGIPGVIVKTLTALTMADMNDIDTDNQELLDIIEENNFKELLNEAVTTALYLGDGAFKISIDPDVSEHPIIEFIPADRTEYIYRRGRLHEVIFSTEIKSHENRYELKEVYGYGYIYYELYDAAGSQVELSTIDALANLQPVIWEDKKLIMAMPFMIFKSSSWKGRGQSIFDSKRDNFDALDESWSQWMDALRAGRSKTYIPEDLLPRNPMTLQVISPNSFDNRFIATGASAKENDRSQITVDHPVVPTESYLQTYVTALDLCLQGIISPSSLGIDAKKIDNAEAQREKEKATLYTRNAIVQAIQKTIPSFLQMVWWTEQNLKQLPLDEIEIDIPFGEYANPSFESQVETLGKARTQGIMSVEATVEELYGDTKEESWKQEEIQRLKNEQGIVDEEEPSSMMDLEDFESDEPIPTGIE